MRPDILTAKGRCFDFTRPGDCLIDIEEIAHALAHICRYTGHVREVYWVAQHSLLVARLVPLEHARAGLLHDAAEAYIGDVAAPLKMLLPDYKAIERQVEAVVFSRLGLPDQMPDCVREADQAIRAVELRDLMPEPLDLSKPFGPGDLPMGAFRIKPMPPEVARRTFLERYAEVSAAGFLDGLSELRAY